MRRAFPPRPALRILLAIADSAGERWQARARDALRELAGVGATSAVSERQRLLADCHEVFSANQNPTEMATTALLEGLIALEEAPWRGWWAI